MPNHELILLSIGIGTYIPSRTERITTPRCGIFVFIISPRAVLYDRAGTIQGIDSIVSPYILKDGSTKLSYSAFNL